jgi:hypothetical protein
LEPNWGSFELGMANGVSDDEVFLVKTSNGTKNKKKPAAKEIHDPNAIRPYRSRRQRPCDYCRRRKMGCNMVDETVCLLCKRKGVKCSFLDEPVKKKRSLVTADKNVAAAAPKTSTSIEPRTQNLSMPTVIDVPPLEPPPPQVEALLDERDPPLIPEGYDSGAVLGLTGDQDPYLLQYYNYDENQASSFIKHALRRVSDNPAFPIQFLAFKDERGQAVNSERGSQRTKIDKLAGKFEQRLLALYFRFVHPTYPIVDKMIFYRDYYYNKDNINPGLMAGLLALSCIWWKYDSILCVHSIPPGLSADLYNECSIAVNRDIKYPSLSTVQALLLLLQRRLLMDQMAETYAVTVELSRLIAVSHNLGLHLDCSNWPIPPSVKRLRRKLWATIYIMEKWTSVNTGSPSLLSASNTTIGVYDSDDPSEKLFVYLGRLTTILDGIVDQLYSVRYVEDRYYDVRGTLGKVGHFIRMLTNWRCSLPDDLKDMQSSLPGEFCLNGTLHLSALTVEVLLHRIHLHPVCGNHPQYPEYRAQAADTIRRVVKFTSEITHSHLHAFWYSMSRLNFSTIAHFAFLHHITSPTSDEYRETKEMLRKWLWALRVLSQGWEEGTGLATFCMDTVFWMGKNLFPPPPPPAAASAVAAAAAAPLPPPRNKKEDIPPKTQISTPTPAHVLPAAFYEEKNEPHRDSTADEVPDIHQMLLLNEDIMPQQEQIDLFLVDEVPDDLADAYAEYFDNERYKNDQGIFTEQLHELLATGLNDDFWQQQHDHR